MKKQQIMAAALAAGIGLTGLWQTNALAETVIIEEDMEETPEDTETAEMNWQLRQKLDVESCKQGQTITLTVSLTGDTRSMKLSTIYAAFQYDAEVFKISAEDITPVKSGAVDYISIDEDTGEIDVYYADDVTYETGEDLLTFRLHVLDDAEAGLTEVGVEDLELYAGDNDVYAVIENAKTVNVSVVENTPAVVLGDVNQDGKINLTDVKLIVKHCNNGAKLSAAQQKNADVNQDGKVNLTDAKLIMKYCNGQIKKF